MKKITLLFATLLAMSGLAFGQKEGKLLWEKTTNEVLVSSNFQPNYTVNKLAVAPNGSILTFTGFGSSNVPFEFRGPVSAFDKDGKMIWESKNYLTFGPRLNPGVMVRNNYVLLANDFGYRDTTFYFNKNFDLQRVLDNSRSKNTYLLDVEDGVIHNDSQNFTVKYDSEGKEQWRYKNEGKCVFLNQKAPYFGLLGDQSDKHEIIILDENGKRKGISEPQTFSSIIPSHDKGFWLINAYYEKIKFDSTGRQTAKVSPIGGQYNVSSDGNSVLSDNSLLLSFVNDKALYLKKTSAKGDEIDLTIPFPYQIRGGNFFKFKEIAPNIIMYAIAMPEREIEANIIYKIGVVDFNDSSKSWSKDVRGGASNGTYGNTFTFEANNTFFQVFPSPINPPDKFFKVYDIKGNLTWESPFFVPSARTQTDRWRIIGEYLYVAIKLYQSADGLVTGGDSGNKIIFANGKDVWNRKDISFTDNNMLKDIQRDKNGNDVIIYPKYVGFVGQGGFYTYRIETLNPDGSEKWHYTYGKSDNYEPKYFVNTYFSPTNDGKLIVYSAESGGNYILRKVSPCEALNAIAITANKTEACPTEKIKLSTPKQDGLTYQWQKDGKDIPTFKDIAYDFGESGTYTVTVKDEVCQNQTTSNALKINIRTIPTAQIQAPKTTFCEGDKTVITAQTNGTFFQWQKDEKDIPNATSGIFEASAAGFYRVGVRDDKCPQVGFSNIIPITLKPIPEATITTDIKTVIYEPFTVKMTANSGTGLAYQWLKDDVIIPNETTVNYEAKKSGKYNVSVSKDGCTKTSEALTISILIPLANEGEIGEDVVKVYPNPSRGEFKIVLPKTLQNADIQLFDLLGRERTLIRIGEQAQADGLVQGMYFLRVSKGEKTVTSKLVIE
jgi:hypothetical protein